MKYDYIEYFYGKTVPDTEKIVSLMNELNDLSGQVSIAFGEVFDLRPWLGEFRSWLELYYPLDYFKIMIYWLQSAGSDISLDAYVERCLQLGIDSIMSGEKDFLCRWIEFIYEDPDKLQNILHQRDVLKESLLLRYNHH